MAQTSKASDAPKSYTWGVIVISVGFFGVFMAYNTAQALATSLLDKDLARACIGLLYFTFALTCVFAPAIVRYMSPKWAVILGAIPYVALVFTNLKPSWGLSLPFWILVGLGAGLVWTGQGMFVGASAILQSRSWGTSDVVETGRYNSIFFGSFQFNGFTGTVLASAIQQGLTKHYGPGDEHKINDILFIVLGCAAGLGVLIFLLLPDIAGAGEATEHAAKSTEAASLLDAPGPPGSGTAAATAPSQAGSIQRRGGGNRVGSIGSDGGSIGAPDGPMSDAFSPENLRKQQQQQGKDEGTQQVGLVQTLMLAMTDPRMGLLLPNILYNGMSLGFFFGDFASFYTANGTARDLLPKSNVGYVTASFYLVNAVFSWFLGNVAAIVGRRGTVYIAVGAHVLFFALMLVLLSMDNPKEGSWEAWAQAFGPAVLFAIGDAVWESQVPATLQSSHYLPRESDREAAMGNLKMWQSVGFAVQMGIGIGSASLGSLGLWVKIWILLGLHVLQGTCLIVADLFVQRFDEAEHRQGQPGNKRGAPAVLRGDVVSGEASSNDEPLFQGGARR